MRRLASLLLAACLALSLTGCLAQEEEPPAPSESPSAAPSDSPKTLRFSLGYDPTASLHPITGTSQVNQELTGLVYQGLYELDNSFTPRPALVQSAAPSQDGTLWTFTLKTDVLFSDGTPLTAQHAAASLNAARQGGPYAQRLSGVAAVTAVDDATLTIALSAPNGALPALLDVPVVLEQEGAFAPLGSGRYQYETAGERLYLHVNPNCPAAAALPYSTIPLTPVSSADERIAAFDCGDITAVTTEFSSPYALGYSSSYEACGYPTTTLLYLGFQTARGACQSPLVRQAVSRALDRETIVQTLLSGHGDPACLPISPLHGDYDGEAAALLAYDLEEAALLLAQAGYEPSEEDGLLYRRRAPLELTLLVNSDNEARQGAAEALAEALRALGAAVTVRTLPWSSYTAALARGDFDLYIGEVRLTGDFDPAPLLTGALNYGGYSSQDAALALAQWRAAQGEARTEAARALCAQLAQDVPIAPLCFKRGSLLVRWGMVSNLQPTRANPFYRMEDWSTTSNR